MTKIFVSFLTIFIFSSCAFHSGMMTGNASINNADFKYVALAEGTATTTHVLGIGGLKKQALMFEAKKDMLANYPLRKGQALANVTVDIKKTFVLIAVKTRMTVTADVVDFNFSESAGEIDSDLSNNYEGSVKIGVHDSVYFKQHGFIQKGEVANFNKKSAKVRYSAANGSTYYAYTAIEQTLLKNPTDKEVAKLGFKVNEKVLFLNDEGGLQEGVIFGINQGLVGIKYNFNTKGNFSWKIIARGRVQKLR